MATPPLKRLQNPENYCWINAALHAVFAPRIVRDVVGSAPVAAGKSWDWWRFHKRGRRGGQSRSEEPNFDALLGVALRDMTGDLRGLPVLATAVAKVFYRQAQEDAHEFLMELLGPDRAKVVAVPFCYANT
eukprot:3623322-Pyramimonas_sp.AAC.1